MRSVRESSPRQRDSDRRLPEEVSDRGVNGGT